MNREILFKAKRKNWRKLPKDEWWVKGYYAVIGKKHVVINQQSEDYYSVDDGIKKGHGNEIIEIIPETVCRYTGLIDKNKNQIFESDIVRLNVSYCGGTIRQYDCKVVFDEFGVSFENLKRENDIAKYGDDVGKSDIEVIGNIFDLKE